MKPIDSRLNSSVIAPNRYLFNIYVILKLVPFRDGSKACSFLKARQEFYDQIDFALQILYLYYIYIV